MAVVKRSVSFEAEVWSELTAAAGGGAFSPLVNEAVAFYLRRRRGLAAVAAYEAEHGAFTRAELESADRGLDQVGVPDLTSAQPTRVARSRARTRPR